MKIMKMNWLVKWGTITLLSAGVVTVIAVYSFSLGQRRAIAAERSGSIATLSAAECLRDGKPDKGLNLIENYCYSTALRLMREPGARNDFTVRTLMPNLVRYRMQFARSPDKWSATEKSLEDLLGSFRSTNAFLPRPIEKPALGRVAVQPN